MTSLASTRLRLSSASGTRRDGCAGSQQARTHASAIRQTCHFVSLTVEQRREMVAALLSEVDDHGVGVHSPNAVADALGVSRDTVQRDAAELADVGKLVEPTHSAWTPRLFATTSSGQVSTS